MILARWVPAHFDDVGAFLKVLSQKFLFNCPFFGYYSESFSKGDVMKIAHFEKYHNTYCAPKFCMSIVSSFSWDLQWPQEKTTTMLMQNLGRQTKSIMVFSEVGYLILLLSPTIQLTVQQPEVL